MNVLRILTFSAALYCNFATCSDLKKNKNFFEKPIYVFSKKPKFRTFWDIFLIELQSASNWLLLAVSKKTQDDFWTTIFFSRRNQVLNVLRSPTISVASYNKFLSLAISKKSFFFSKNPYILFFITKFWRFREVLLFQSHFTASLLHSAIFLKKSNFSSQKTHHIFPSEKLKFDFL